MYSSYLLLQDCWILLSIYVFFSFFKVFGGHMCPILGTLVPLFWISGDISSGFQSQSGFCIICLFCGDECNVHSPRSPSGATPADLLMAGITVSHQQRWELAGIWTGNHPHRQQMHYYCASDPAYVYFLIMWDLRDYVNEGQGKNNFKYIVMCC